MAKPDSVVLQQLQSWEAPVLSDEEVEIYARTFLMRLGHELVPFFMWIDATRVQARTRHSV